MMYSVKGTAIAAPTEREPARGPVDPFPVKTFQPARPPDRFRIFKPSESMPGDGAHDGGRVVFGRGYEGRTEEGCLVDRDCDCDCGRRDGGRDGSGGLTAVATRANRVRERANELREDPRNHVRRGVRSAGLQSALRHQGGYDHPDRNEQQRGDGSRIPPVQRGPDHDLEFREGRPRSRPKELPELERGSKQRNRGARQLYRIPRQLE